jgi:uncharacterized membrane protein
MTTLFTVLSTWLHSLVTLIFIGYYIFTCLIFLPVLERQMEAERLRDLLKQVSARLQHYFGGSLLVFLVTGTYLMLINKNYRGLGQIFANPWSILMITKHLLLLVFLALAILPERVFFDHKSDDKPEAIKPFKLALIMNMLLGMLILLLTSIAQAL